MPTYFTAELDENDMPTAQWLKERLIRNFGVAITLKEERETDQDQIMEALAPPSSTEKYYEEKLAELRTELEAIKNMLPPGIELLIEQKNIGAQIRNDERRAESKRMRTIFDRARTDLVKVIKETDDEITRNVAQFGLDQLDMVEGKHRHSHGVNEVKCYQEEAISAMPEEWRQQEVGQYERDIDYQLKELDKERKNTEERYRLYIKFVDEVDRILPGEC